MERLYVSARDSKEWSFGEESPCLAKSGMRSSSIFKEGGSLAKNSMRAAKGFEISFAIWCTIERSTEHCERWDWASESRKLVSVMALATSLRM